MTTGCSPMTPCSRPPRPRWPDIGPPGWPAWWCTMSRARSGQSLRPLMASRRQSSGAISIRCERQWRAIISANMSWCAGPMRWPPPVVLRWSSPIRGAAPVGAGGSIHPPTHRRWTPCCGAMPIATWWSNALRDWTLPICGNRRVSTVRSRWCHWTVASARRACGRSGWRARGGVPPCWRPLVRATS
ncbi:Uncharacterised protein [Mycobacteroides abscessus subsp. abscessus]|nr:Uncharacterised protein [Mycobacteroides abscessus subsp. abscessus]